MTIDLINASVLGQWALRNQVIFARCSIHNVITDKYIQYDYEIYDIFPNFSISGMTAYL